MKIIKHYTPLLFMILGAGVLCGCDLISTRIPDHVTNPIPAHPVRTAALKVGDRVLDKICTTKIESSDGVIREVVAESSEV